MSCSGIDSTTILTAVRVRPFTTRELHEGNELPVVQMPKPGIVRLLPKCHINASTRQFVFDHTFWSFNRRPTTVEYPLIQPESDKSKYADQTAVYKTIAFPLLLRALKGYNACLLAYGMTSSGKTHSITGPPDDPGIIPLLVKDLFHQIMTHKSPDISYFVELSYFEIYNERIRDLLCVEKSEPSRLAVREHPVTGPYVEGLCRIGVASVTDVMGWFRAGNRQRTVAVTEENDHSSRSHTLFTLYLTRRTIAKYPFGDAIESVLTSQITIVDLAGSERQCSTNSFANRFNESCQINKSLFTLGRVISQLSRRGGGSVDRLLASEPRLLKAQRCAIDFKTPVGSRAQRLKFVSYRDSVLTWLLKESLGGNSLTVMLATISPSALHYDETLATLNYAKKAQSIVNAAVINVDPQSRIIRYLMSEVARLRELATVRLISDGPLVSEESELSKLITTPGSEASKSLQMPTEPTSPHKITPVAISRFTSDEPLRTCSETSSHYRPVLVDRATSPLTNSALNCSPFNVATDCTPLKRYATMNCSEWDTRIRGPDRPHYSTEDAATETCERWSCNRDEHERIVLRLVRLNTRLTNALRENDSLRQSLIQAQSLNEMFHSQCSNLLHSLLEHMPDLIKMNDFLSPCKGPSDNIPVDDGITKVDVLRHDQTNSYRPRNLLSTSEDTPVGCDVPNKPISSRLLQSSL